MNAVEMLHVKRGPAVVSLALFRLPGAVGNLEIRLPFLERDLGCRIFASVPLLDLRFSLQFCPSFANV